MKIQTGFPLRFPKGNRYLRAVLTGAAINLCAWGQTTSWQDMRLPSHGDVSALGHSGTALYAGTGSGRIFRSSDDGITWYGVMGPGNAPIRKFLFHDSVYLAASGDLVDMGLFDCFSGFCTNPVSQGGLFRSTDHGRTWVGNDLRAATAMASDGHNLYAATLSGWYRSTDYGRQWKRLVTSTLPGENIESVAIWSMECLGGKLYVRTRNDLFQGSLKGDTVFLAATLTRIGNQTGGGGMAVIPPYLFASSPGKLQRTQDGIHWNAIADREFPVLYVSGNASGKKLLGMTAYGKGIAESDDSGKTWSPLPVPPRNAVTLCAHGSVLFEGFRDVGVLALRSRGGSWEATGPGLYDNPVTGMVLRQGAPVALAEGSGLFQGSAASAPIWKKIPAGMFSTKARLTGFEGDAFLLDGYSLRASRAVKPEAWDTLAPCYDCQAVVAGSGWQAAFNSDNSILLCEAGNACVTLPRVRLPQAVNVYPIGKRLVNGFQSGAAHGDTLIIALDSLYRSPDRGRTWSLLGTLPGYDPVLGYGSGTWKLAFGKTLQRGDLTVYSGLLSSSHDGGLTWKQDHPDDVNPVAKVMVFRSGETYLGTGTGVYLFREGATAWQKLGTVNSEFNVTSLAVEGHQLVAGLGSGAVLEWHLETVGIREAARGTRSGAQGQWVQRPGLIQSGGKWRQLNGRVTEAPRNAH